MGNTTTTAPNSLYQRLGGETGVRNIANDVLDKNASNPLIAHHFKGINMEKLKQLVFEFFSMGTGGPHTYTGRDMVTTHTGMNITESDWVAATDDTIWTLNKNGIEQPAQDEVIAILESLKDQVVGK